MNFPTHFRSAVSLLVGMGILLPTLAFAETSLDAAVNGSVNTNTPTSANTTVSGSVTISAAVMTRAKTKADNEIDRRIKALNELNARVQGMTKVSAEFKKNLNTNIQAQLTALASLKVKIDGDTDGANLKADIQSIAQNYRIFMLVMPQARIAAAADREATMINMLTGIGGKLQANVQAAQKAGVDVTAMGATLTDMGTKISSAQTHAQAAISGSATLTPDNGDKDKMKANTTALQNARAEIEAARKDLTAARKDIDSLLKALRSLNATASSTVKVQ